MPTNRPGPGKLDLNLISALVVLIPDIVADEPARLGRLEIDPCPVVTPPLRYTLAPRDVVDRDPGERRFRNRVVASFAPAEA